MTVYQPSRPSGSCIVGSCKREASIRMSIKLPNEPERESDFCEKCAPHHEPVWTRVDEPEQLTLDA